MLYTCQTRMHKKRDPGSFPKCFYTIMQCTIIKRSFVLPVGTLTDTLLRGVRSTADNPSILMVLAVVLADTGIHPALLPVALGAITVQFVQPDVAGPRLVSCTRVSREGISKAEHPAEDGSIFQVPPVVTHRSPLPVVQDLPKAVKIHECQYPGSNTLWYLNITHTSWKLETMESRKMIK